METTWCIAVCIVLSREIMAETMMAVFARPQHPFILISNTVFIDQIENRTLSQYMHNTIVNALFK
jgi:hypothetical protein